VRNLIPKEITSYFAHINDSLTHVRLSLLWWPLDDVTLRELAQLSLNWLMATYELKVQVFFNIKSTQLIELIQLRVENSLESE